MKIDELRAVYGKAIKPFGEALEGIYAEGGLMAHHDGVNAAVKKFWNAAQAHLANPEGTRIDQEEFDDMYGSIVHLTINANTRVEDIVGARLHQKVLNSFDPV